MRQLAIVEQIEGSILPFDDLPNVLEGSLFPLILNRLAHSKI